MTEILRRSFVKGLFLAAASPLIIGTPVLASTLNLARVEVYYQNMMGPTVKIMLDDNTDQTGVLRAYIDNTLQYLNKTAFESHDNYHQILMIQDQVSQLQPLKENRFLYQYRVISDGSNTTEDMYNRGIKVLDSYLQTTPTGFYGFRFGYDPSLA